MSHFVRVCHEVGKEQHGKKNKESTWSTCCELLSELVSLLQLVKPPLIYVLRGHDIGDEDKYGTRCLLAKRAL